LSGATTYLKGNPIPTSQVDYHQMGKDKRDGLLPFLEKALAMYKNDPVPVASYQPFIHGTGGLLAAGGQDPALFSPMIQPLGGMSERMPLRNDPVVDSDYGGQDTPLMTFINGVTSGASDDWDNQIQSSCDDPPVAGVLKACTITAPFGKFAQSVEMVFDREARLTNLGETQNYQLINNNPAPADPFVSERLRGGLNFSELGSRLFAAGISMRRLIAPLIYTGTPANNVNLTGGARQFKGFETLINTNYVDFYTEAPCGAVNSLILSFGNTNIMSPDGNGVYIYQHMQNVKRYMQALADESGISPVNWVWVMRPDLFWRLTDIWQVQQYYYAIAMMDTINTAAQGGQVHLDATVYDQARQNMRNTRMIPVDGEMMEVVLDNAIPETTGGGLFLTDIYLVPMTVMGGYPVTYWQFFNFDNARSRAILDTFGQPFLQVTDGGRVWWAKNFRNGCFSLNAYTEPRIMFHTPYLGARIQNVGYDPGIHSRDWLPSDANFYDGGRASAGGTANSGVASGLPIFYPDWTDGVSAVGVLD